MKSKYFFPLITFLTLIGFWTNSIKAQKFTSTDTLVLQTQKHKGYGLFEGGFGRLKIEDITDNDELFDLIPSGISHPRLAIEFIDMKLFAYENIKKNNPENLEAYIKANYPEKIDTANFPSEIDNSLRIILGMKGLDSVYIIDENGNHDYRDDPVRPLNKINYGAPLPEAVKCHYWIYNGKEMVKDSGWVIVAKGRDNQARILVAQHLTSAFSLNDQEYEIQVISWIPHSGFCFDTPNIGISAQNGVKKDSLLLSERLELGEYLKFGESYYKFAKITNDGSQITLIREEDVSDKIGKQVGFIAPDYTCVTTEGDKVSPADYQNKYVLLVNVTACWSEPMSYVIYKKLSDKYLSEIDILVIDESPALLQRNIDQLGLKGKFAISPDNRILKESYREDYCSRTCFLIDPDGHIIDKFEIFDWEQALANHFE